MSFIIAKDIHTHTQCRKIIANYSKIMQMTNASTKAVASLTPCLRPSSFGAPATTVSRGRCALREAKCSLRRNFCSTARKRMERRVIQIPT